MAIDFSSFELNELEGEDPTARELAKLLPEPDQASRFKSQVKAEWPLSAVQALIKNQVPQYRNEVYLKLYRQAVKRSPELEGMSLPRMLGLGRVSVGQSLELLQEATMSVIKECWNTQELWSEEAIENALAEWAQILPIDTVLNGLMVNKITESSIFQPEQWSVLQKYWLNYGSGWIESLDGSAPLLVKASQCWESQHQWWSYVNEQAAQWVESGAHTRLSWIDPGLTLWWNIEKNQLKVFASDSELLVGYTQVPLDFKCPAKNLELLEKLKDVLDRGHPLNPSVLEFLMSCRSLTREEVNTKKISSPMNNFLTIASDPTIHDFWWMNQVTKSWEQDHHLWDEFLSSSIKNEQSIGYKWIQHQVQSYGVLWLLEQTGLALSKGRTVQRVFEAVADLVNDSHLESSKASRCILGSLLKLDASKKLQVKIIHQLLFWLPSDEQRQQLLAILDQGQLVETSEMYLIKKEWAAMLPPVQQMELALSEIRKGIQGVEAAVKRPEFSDHLIWGVEWLMNHKAALDLMTAPSLSFMPERVKVTTAIGCLGHTLRTTWQLATSEEEREQLLRVSTMLDASFHKLFKQHDGSKYILDWVNPKYTTALPTMNESESLTRLMDHWKSLGHKKEYGLLDLLRSNDQELPEDVVKFQSIQVPPKRLSLELMELSSQGWISNRYGATIQSMIQDLLDFENTKSGVQTESVYQSTHTFLKLQDLIMTNKGWLLTLHNNPHQENLELEQRLTTMSNAIHQTVTNFNQSNKIEKMEEIHFKIDRFGSGLSSSVKPK